MFSAMSFLADGKQDSRYDFSPNVSTTKKKQKTQQRKNHKKKNCKNHLEHIRRIPTFFLTFILNLNMQGGLSTSIHIPSLLSGPNIESGFKALQMLLLLSNYE